MNSLIPKACFFTGHRIIRKTDIDYIIDRLRYEIENKIKDGVMVFIAGGATGFDMMAQQAVLDLKERYPEIRLCLYLPCCDQAEHWSEKDRERYFSYLKSADEVYYVSREKYADGCMKRRNSAMVEAADCGIAYAWAGRSGTGQTLRMAEKKGIEVIKI